MEQTATPAASTPKKKSAKSAAAHTLFIAIDYGTKTLSVSWRIDGPGIDPSKTHVIEFSTNVVDAPQLVAFKDGKVYWGYEAEEALRRGDITREDTFELWKLALYKHHKTSRIVAHTDEHLERLDMDKQDLITAHLDCVLDFAMGKIAEATPLFYGLKARDLPRKLLLSVPRMWTPTMHRLMSVAARPLAFQAIGLVYEPHCAVGYFATLLAEGKQVVFKAGDIILVADMGGGTSDLSAFRVKSGSDQGAALVLELACPSAGALSGSEFVNEQFLDWLKGHSLYQAKLEQSGLSEYAFLREAAAAFEKKKLEFSPSHTAQIRILIEAGEEEWVVKLSQQEMLELFKPVIDENIALIESQLLPGTTTIIVPGGFGKSPVLQQALQHRYGGRFTIYGFHNVSKALQQPVSTGALLRYQIINVRGIPSSASFGFAQIETFDPTIHPDGLLAAGGRRSAKGLPVRTLNTKIDRRIVDYDHIHKESIVRERWTPILTKGTVIDSGKEFRTRQYQRFVVEPYQETISVQVYWTELDIEEHAPMRVGKDGTHDLIDGIEPWGDPVVLQLPDLKKAGFQLSDHPQPVEDDGDDSDKEEAMEVDREVYELHVLFVLICDGANISLKGQILAPHCELYDEHGNLPTSGLRVLKSGRKVVEIWEQNFDPSVRD